MGSALSTRESWIRWEGTGSLSCPTKPGAKITPEPRDYPLRGRPGPRWVLAHAALPVNPQPSKNHDRSIVDLPEVEQTAAIVHRGSMDNILRIIRTLARSSTQLDTARLIT